MKMSEEEAVKIIQESKGFTFDIIADVKYRLPVTVVLNAIANGYRLIKDNPERDRQESRDYCADCDHIEMCRWYPTDGCEWLSTKKE